MKKLFTEADILKLHQKGTSILPLGENDILTPSAKDRVKALGIKIITKEEADKIRAEESKVISSAVWKRAAVGGDHTGFKVKNMIIKILTGKGFEVIDVGTFDENACDYPDFAFASSMKVKEGYADFAVLIDATGIPSAITANKVPGIRAATCYNEFSARSSREHNNSNVLVIGAKALGEETIKSILEVWLTTKFGGERHQRRLDKITAIEQQFNI
jgi:ribose 5-phosphate isomerase B